MKKCFFLLLSLLFLLCACGENRAPASAFGSGMIDGKEYVIDYSQNTINFDGHVCTFEIFPDAGGIRLNITYPDGSTYWWMETGQGGYGGWSDDYDEERYVSGDVLRQALALEQFVEEEESHGNPVAGLLLIVLGAFNAWKPETAWKLEYGWRYKNAEPSDLALGANRLGGIFAILFGIVLFFI